MKPQILLYMIAVALIFATASCKKKNNDEQLIVAESIILKHQGGFTRQPSFYVYKITDSNLTEDTSATAITSRPYNFNVNLSATLHQQVVYLLQEIPNGLLKQNNAVFKTSKYPDAGGVTVIATINGSEYEWYFSDITEEMTGYTKVFADKVVSSTAVLNAQ